MKKVMTLLLLGVYLFSNVEFCQLLKMPLLVEHYHEFVANGEGDLLDFLVHHYGGHEMDSDWDTDMKLPFMKLAADHSIAFYVPRFSLEIPSPTTEPIAALRACGKTQQFLPSYFANILQPPRLA